MNIQEFEVHARTYHRFSLAVKWFVLHFAVLAVFLTVWFATSAGFGWALIAAIILGAVGVWAMQHGLARSSEHETPPPSGPPVAHA